MQQKHLQDQPTIRSDSTAPTGYFLLLLATPATTLYPNSHTQRGGSYWLLMDAIGHARYYPVPLILYTTSWLLLVTFWPLPLLPSTLIRTHNVAALTENIWTLLATHATTLYLQPSIPLLGYFLLHFGHSRYYPLPSKRICGSSY